MSFDGREAWLLAVVVGAVALVRAGGPALQHDGHRVHRPNLLVITTDDQTLSQFRPRVMPFTWRFFRRAGSVFTNAIAVPPLCCPSRAGFLTGDYPHNHGVLTNDAGYNYLVDKGNTLPVWLSRAGYRTALVGKYLNGYPALGPTVPPGWDYFFAAGGVLDYFNFEVGVNGRARHFGGGRYSTEVSTDAARRFVRDSAKRDRPFFAWLTYNAPHTVPDGAPPCAGHRAQPQTAADYRRFGHAPLTRSSALSERDVSDKGRWVRTQTPLSARRLKRVRKSWRCALSSLAPVDRGLRSIVADLRRLGELHRTLVVFTSDNGSFYGEHGIPDGKELPYDPALRVPLAIAVPPDLGDGPSPPSKIDALVSNVDLARTLLDYAHALPCKKEDRCRTLDGHSLRSLLAGATPAWTRTRAIPIELDDDFTYRALRTPNLLYLELSADRIGPLVHPEVELYDLRDDPVQLHNLWAEDRAANRDRRRRLAARLRRLVRCAGPDGRQACP